MATTINDIWQYPDPGDRWYASAMLPSAVGGDQADSYEISIVRGSYQHGFTSFGWAGDRKVILGSGRFEHLPGSTVAEKMSALCLLMSQAFVMAKSLNESERIRRIRAAEGADPDDEEQPTEEGT